MQDEPVAGDSRAPTERVPSPEATGGAGGNFEARVGAIVLSRLLRGDCVEGLEQPFQRVGFQERYAGHMLDDLVVEGRDTLGNLRVIEYQAKRRVSPAPSDGEFVETILRCLEAIRDEAAGGDVERQRRRFGLVSTASVALNDLKRVTVVARSHRQDASFLEVIRTTASAGVRQRLRQLRETVNTLLADSADPLAPPPLDSDVDLFTWKVARALHVWQLDAEPSGMSVLDAQSRLDDLTLDATASRRLFGMLVELVRDWGPQAANVDRQMLLRALEERGVVIDQAPAHEAAFQTLLAASSDTLTTSVARLGNHLQLARTAIRDEVADAVSRHDGTLLSGRAGVGKSMIARLVAEDLRTEGATVLGIGLTGRSGSIAALEAELGVRLADAFAGAPIGARRVLVLDGAEQALSDAGTLLQTILSALPRTGAGAPPWSVLLTARDEAAGTVERILKQQLDDVYRMSISELSDPEIAQVVDAFPALQPLQRNRRAEALLLRRPYLVELLIRSTAVDGLNAGVVGEEDLMDVVTTRVIRRDNGGLPGVGEPGARSDIYMALAADAIADQFPSLLDGRDAEARRGLHSDDVIAPARPTQLSWRFAHDVLVDYAVATRLLEPGGKVLLRAAHNPRRLLRGVRLSMQRRLADGCGEGRLVSAWNAIAADAEELAAADGDRWRDLPYEALLHLGPAREALPHLIDVLLTDDGTALLRLIDVSERLARLNVSYGGVGPIPLDVALTGPVVDLLGSIAGQVPQRCVLRAARLVHHHLAAAFSFNDSSEAGLEAAAALPDALVTWAGDASYGDTLELCLGSLGFLGRHVSGDSERFLMLHAQADPHHVAEAVESPGSAAALAADRPDLMLRVAGLYYLGRALTLDGQTGETGERPRSTFSSPHTSPFESLDGDEQLDEDGVRDHDPNQADHLAMIPLGNNQANPAMGPFLRLLEGHPAEGLRLVGAVVDPATAARQRVESRFDHGSDDEPQTLSLSFGDPPESRTFTGPGSVWCWHRRTTIGAGPAQSALMALRQWASAQVIQGAPISEIRDRIIRTGDSLAFPAVAWFVMLEHLDEVDDEMDPFLVHPQVWSLEGIRRVHEPGGLALEVPEVTRLEWTVSEVAMQLVLRADAARRGRLAAMGQQLLENARSSGREDLAVVQRRASELDIANYRAEQHEQGIAVTVEYDPDLLATLQASGAQAQRGLQGAGLMRRASAMRDGQEDLSLASQLWDEALAYVDDADGTELYKPLDLVAGAAAGLVRAGHEGEAVEGPQLTEAVATLLEMAEHVADAAPPNLDTFLPEGSRDAPETSRLVREMYWDAGFDRSLCTALPWLMADPSLMERAAVSPAHIASALVQSAAAPYNEARSRLATGLTVLWDKSCTEDATAHEALVAACNRIVETSGYGPLSPHGYGYAHATLPSPVADYLRTASKTVLELGPAAYAIPVLAAGAALDCPHSSQARDLMDALLRYDENVWPENYARHHYRGIRLWRSSLDRMLARQILSGDLERLDRRLEVFAPVGEQLAGLLAKLSEEAKDSDSATRLHALWPRVLDSLLPDARNLEVANSGRSRRRDRPSYRDVEELDQALLLVPADGIDCWPWIETARLARRWLDAFAANPRLADRAIRFSGRLFGLSTEPGAHFVLRVLGENAEAVKRDSSLAVAFLQAILRNPPTPGVASKARSLLDGLAVLGDEFALDVQRELENG